MVVPNCCGGGLFVALFACLWASSLAVRQDGGDVSLGAHYVSRVVEIAVLVCLALAARRRRVGARGLAGASLVLLAAYCLLEMLRPLLASETDTMAATAVGVLSGTANGGLVACLMLLSAFLLRRFAPRAAGIIVPLSLAAAHAFFLATGLMGSVSVAWAKALLLAVATLGLTILARHEGMGSLSQPDTSGEAARVLNHVPQASLCLGAGVFPFLYGFMAQVCDVAGVSSGLFDVTTELVGIAVLMALALAAGLWRGHFDVETIFLVVLPVFATALLILPVFWGSEVFAAGFVMKCGFLAYTALMVVALHRLTLGDEVACVRGYSLALAAFHGALMVGRLAASRLVSAFELSFSTMAFVALAAVWILSMTALVVVVAGQKRRRVASRAVETASGAGIAAFDAFAKAVRLSERERAVCWEYARGRTVEHIAQTLSVSQETVKTHLKRAYAKASCHSRQELIDAIEAHVPDAGHRIRP